MSQKNEARLRRARRARAKIAQLKQVRLCVHRSNSHIYAQVIDDTQGHTLVSASTTEPEVREQIDGLSKTEQSRVVGRVLAERALDKGIRTVVFDRGGYKYHGRVKALAEGARNSGLEF